MFTKIKSSMDGINSRVLMLVTGITLALMAAQVASDTFIEVKKIRSQHLEDALSTTNIVARSLEKQFEFFELQEIEKILASVRTIKNVVQVSAVDKNHTFELDGDTRTSTLMGLGDRIEEQEQAIQSGMSVHSFQDESYTVAEPLISDSGVIGAVMVKYSHPSLSKVLYPILKSCLISIVPILLLGLLIASMLVRQITRPLLRLTNAVETIEQGDLNEVITVDGPKEVRNLGNNLKSMVATLKRNMEQIYELAYVDKTTELPNREFFRKELTRAIHKVTRYNQTGALLFIDLDGFKRVNDTHGHDVGDDILRQFSQRLEKTLRAEDFIGFFATEEDNSKTHSEGEAEVKEKQMLARLGGDEFTVVLSELREATDAATVSNRIITVLDEPFDVKGMKISIGASIGIAIFPQDGNDYQSILKSADMAMYQAKEQGKNTFRYFSKELNEEASRRMEIESDLRKALDAGDQLELHYQPKIDCKTGRAKSAEALIRWNHPEKGMIPPFEFISIAEDCGLILPIGKWVIEEACRQIVKLDKLGIDLSIAVNVSSAQFDRADMVDIIMEVVEETGADATRLELELTESMAMQNPKMVLQHIHALKEIGIKVAIDDFGTGYSNLSQLSKLPFDVFKIDRSFVMELTNGEEHAKVIVKTILAMAQSLDYETVAEGVECQEEFDFLAKHGCTYAQGYLFAKPLPQGQFVEWIKSNKAPVKKKTKVKKASKVSEVA